MYAARVRRAALTLSLVVSAVAFAQEGSPILPERTSAHIVSNRDVNRIYCAGGVDDVIWSAEKPAKVTRSGANVFVKFLVARQGETEARASAPLDVHVVCAGAVYPLVLHPRDVDSVTLRLGDGRRAAVTSVAKDYAALPAEEKVKRFTLALYRNELPDGFVKRPIVPGDPRRAVALFANANLIGQYEVTAPGSGLKGTEYVVHALEPIAVNERDFLDPSLGEIVGITVEPLNIPEDGMARLIVIERALREDTPQEFIR
jgi:conjugal transfer pilus assembly protein TraK